MKQISAAKWHEDNSAIFPSLQGVSHATAAQSSSDNMVTVSQPTYIQLLTLSFIQSDAKVISRKINSTDMRSKHKADNTWLLKSN